MDASDASILSAAAGLVSEDGENLEYDRALAELSVRLIGLSDGAVEPILELIRDEAALTARTAALDVEINNLKADRGKWHVALSEIYEDWT